MKKLYITSIGFAFFALPGLAQQADTATTSKDAIYQRPFITIGKTTTAIGGYVEGNTNYFATDGVSEGFGMELRRFNVFLYSSIAPRIKFLSELEFEHGTEEIALETALIDFEVHPAFNIRTGIILVPIGSFNQNHDSPKWEFIERPLVSTQIIPSTLSEVGFGVHGKFYRNNLIVAYEAYLTNGLRDEIIQNNEGRTSLKAGKNPEMFGEDNNGTPMYSGKLSLRHRKWAEIGLSYYGGIYNTFKLEGTEVAPKQNLSVMAVDFNARLGNLQLNSEAAYVQLDVPAAAGQFFGEKQWGAYIEGVYPVWRRSTLGYKNTVVNACLRAENVDYNVGKFNETGDNIFDEVRAIVPGISIRPSANTVIRANYRYHLERDLLGNPAAHTAGFQVGVASYF